MKERTSVVDWSGNYEETCLQLAKHLGNSKIRRRLFDAIYGRVSTPRSRKQMRVAAGLRPGDEQQAQNELDHLARYGLIRRQDNDGTVNDGSRYLYSKDPNVRAHRKIILNMPTIQNWPREYRLNAGLQLKSRALNKSRSAPCENGTTLMFCISPQTQTSGTRCAWTSRSGR
ncbi:hypothetical protein [Bradyrhizobium sp. STM 3562]|uniref:hypothetical protein n=1 Tax=Bradyrhizobium sp. STM 3562 TaxID=578924 RepID=UPI00388DC02D